MTGLLLYLFGDIVVGLFGGTLLWLTRALNEDKHATPVAVGWFVLVGSALGALSAAAVGWRITTGPAFPGISLVLTPLAMGTMAHAVGRLRSRSNHISHVATWYGGAAVGIGLAAGRFATLRIMGQV